ncbi:MAG: hypothetical protein KJ025_04230 [Burkholderiales bacterium]|nr:hypothetical protein [Burkholderiales bacterium]
MPQDRRKQPAPRVKPPAPGRPNPEAIGTARQDPTFASGERLKLPHERDESPTDLATPGERPVQQRRMVGQAKEDLERGLQDTECLAPHGADSPCPPVPEPAPKRPPRTKKRRTKR